MDVGDTWAAISPDLTNNREQGNVPYSTLTTIEESPLKFGMIWVGTDDGNIQLTTDMGNTWKKVSGSLPQGLWVSRVFASPHNEATAFATLNGYRADDFNTYVYQTNDYGATWQSLKGNLPEDVTNCIIQDPVNPNLLYLGQDHGTYASLDGGKNWDLLGALPNVSGYDLIVHPEANELVVATHGRSMYVLDVTPLQTLAGERREDALYVFDPEKVSHNDKWGESNQNWQEPKEPKIAMMYYCGNEGDEVEITVKDSEGNKVANWKADGGKGLHLTRWDLKKARVKKGESPYLDPGEYAVEFALGREVSEVTLVVEE